MDTLARSGAPLPGEFENLDVLTPFGAVYRYDDYDGTESLNRTETRAMLRSLRSWVETACSCVPSRKQSESFKNRVVGIGT